ncbi:MAG: fructose-bisphosphate aldolase [Desulfobacula sp.]|nr:fructose-bisphosphate aldolase [Desulfobacula sp.]
MLSDKGIIPGIKVDKGLVPIIEPEILINGNHTLDRCERVAQWTLDRIFEELTLQRVFLEGMILKPSMVTSRRCLRSMSVKQENL